MDERLKYYRKYGSCNFYASVVAPPSITMEDINCSIIPFVEL